MIKLRVACSGCFNADAEVKSADMYSMLETDLCIGPPIPEVILEIHSQEPQSRATAIVLMFSWCKTKLQPGHPMSLTAASTYGSLAGPVV